MHDHQTRSKSSKISMRIQLFMVKGHLECVILMLSCLVKSRGYPPVARWVAFWTWSPDCQNTKNWEFERHSWHHRDTTGIGSRKQMNESLAKRPQRDDTRVKSRAFISFTTIDFHMPQALLLCCFPSRWDTQRNVFFNLVSLCRNAVFPL